MSSPVSASQPSVVSKTETLFSIDSLLARSVPTCKPSAKIEDPSSTQCQVAARYSAIASSASALLRFPSDFSRGPPPNNLPHGGKPLDQNALLTTGLPKLSTEHPSSSSEGCEEDFEVEDVSALESEDQDGLEGDLYNFSKEEDQGRVTSCCAESNTSDVGKVISL